ncbi:hypothetical protein PF049_00825 [Erythrobacteraceae bacterium WH01K]|nr:hypothetical protein PF049_00825 [Erythrobacteraceae bacterium WH01K]
MTAIFAWPLALGIACLAGLVLGLTGDGWRDLAAWLLLGAMPLVILAASLRHRGT